MGNEHYLLILDLVVFFFLKQTFIFYADMTIVTIDTTSLLLEHYFTKTFLQTQTGLGAGYIYYYSFKQIR